MNLPVVTSSTVSLLKLPTLEEPEEMIVRHGSFTAVYGGIVYRPVTEVYLSSEAGCRISALALWDTGAMNTCVSADVVRKLASRPAKTEKECCIVTPRDVVKSDFHELELDIPGIRKYKNLMVAKYDFLDEQHIDILIGMDIISEGIMTINNSGGMTKLTFELLGED